MNHWLTCPVCFRVVDKPGPCHHCKRREGVCFLWFIIAISALILCGASSCRGASVVTEEFLDRLAWRESRNNPAAVGRAGELGAYQLRACAVQHVNNKLGWKSSHKAASLRYGREYARAYCQIIEGELRRWLGRQPIQVEVDHAYQLGPTGFLRIQGAGQFRKGLR